MRTFILFLSALITVGCIQNKVELPKLESLQPVVTDTSIILRGEVTYDGGDENAVRGICWSTQERPSTEDFIYRDSITGKGQLMVDVFQEIKSSTPYYMRAFSENSAGKVYGKVFKFEKKHSRKKNLEKKTRSQEHIIQKLNSYSREEYYKSRPITKSVSPSKLKHRKFLLFTKYENRVGWLEFSQYRLKLLDINSNLMSSQTIRGYYQADERTFVLSERWDEGASSVVVFKRGDSEDYIIEIGSEEYIFR